MSPRPAPAADNTIEIGPLRESELAEADRICRIAFGTFLGLPNPVECMGDRHFVMSRWRSPQVKAIAARINGRLIGSNFATRWGSFAFFGPLTVAPEYQGRGVAQRLLEATMAIFEKWGVRHSGLCTFPHSAKHIGLYQKFGYWPRYLTALMTRTPGEGMDPPLLLSALKKSERDQTIGECARLTNRIDKGLDLTGEIISALRQRTGDVTLTRTRGSLDGFAVCLQGAGSEGGEKTCYVKFAAARPGPGAAERFERVLDACEGFASSRGTALEAGVNLAREDAFRRMRARGYRISSQLIAMQRPHAEGFNRPDAWVIDDWR